DAGDRGPDVDAALENAVALDRALSDPAGDGSAAAAAGLPSRTLVNGRSANRDLAAAETRAAALDGEAQALHAHPGFHCAEAQVADLEVAVAWARHEAHEGDDCGATRRLDDSD